MLLACPAVSVSVVRMLHHFMHWACPAVSVSIVRMDGQTDCWGERSDPPRVGGLGWGWVVGRLGGVGMGMGWVGMDRWIV